MSMSHQSSFFFALGLFSLGRKQHKERNVPSREPCMVDGMQSLSAFVGYMFQSQGHTLGYRKWSQLDTVLDHCRLRGHRVLVSTGGVSQYTA